MFNIIFITLNFLDRNGLWQFTRATTEGSVVNAGTCLNDSSWIRISARYSSTVEFAIAAVTVVVATVVTLVLSCSMHVIADDHTKFEGINEKVKPKESDADKASIFVDGFERTISWTPTDTRPKRVPPLEHAHSTNKAMLRGIRSPRAPKPYEYEYTVQLDRQEAASASTREGTQKFNTDGFIREQFSDEPLSEEIGLEGATLMQCSTPLVEAFVAEARPQISCCQ